MKEIAIQSCTVGTWKENAYLVIYGDAAALIDPGDDFSVLDAAFRKEGINYIYIINTHGHFDHVGAVEDFKIQYNIPFYLHSGDKTVLRQTNLYRKITGQTTFVKTPRVDQYLDDMSEIDLRGTSVKIYHTPGHSNGSVCFAIGNNLFSGDIIFEDAVGRTDLPGGNPELLRKSVRFILDNFKGYTVFPGHGNPFILDDLIAAKLETLIQ